MGQGTNDLQKHLVKTGYFFSSQDGKSGKKQNVLTIISSNIFRGETPIMSTCYFKLKTHVTAVTPKRLKDILGGEKGEQNWGSLPCPTRDW